MAATTSPRMIPTIGPVAIVTTTTRLRVVIRQLIRHLSRMIARCASSNRSSVRPVDQHDYQRRPSRHDRWDDLGVGHRGVLAAKPAATPSSGSCDESGGRCGARRSRQRWGHSLRSQYPQRHRQPRQHPRPTRNRQPDWPHSPPCRSRAARRKPYMTAVCSVTGGATT